MTPTDEKRTHRLSVPLTAAEMETICRLYRRRQVPALVRAFLLGTVRPAVAVRPPEVKGNALMQARIVSHLEVISRRVDQSESIPPATAVELQGTLLAILQEMELARGH
jgi:hypothetical protein